MRFIFFALSFYSLIFSLTGYLPLLVLYRTFSDLVSCDSY